MNFNTTPPLFYYMGHQPLTTPYGHGSRWVWQNNPQYLLGGPHQPFFGACIGDGTWPHKNASLPNYGVGNTLALRAKDFDCSIRVKILELMQPRTNSIAMLVEILSVLPQGMIPFLFGSPQETDLSDIKGKRAFLKLSDRRFAESARNECIDSDWTTKTEKVMVEFLATEKGSGMFEAGKKNGFNFTEETSHSRVLDEWKMHSYMRSLHETEVRAYNSLKRHQGERIPKLYAPVTFRYHPIQGRELPSEVLNHEVFQVQGILTEWINGYKLSDLLEHAEKYEWDDIVERAVDVVGEVLNESDVLNKDVSPKNILVSTNEQFEAFKRIVMVDFNMCEFKRDYEKEDDWKLRKSEAEEQSEISELMREKLSRAPYELDCDEPKFWRDRHRKPDNIHKESPETSNSEDSKRPKTA